MRGVWKSRFTAATLSRVAGWITGMRGLGIGSSPPEFIEAFEQGALAFAPMFGGPAGSRRMF